MTKLCTKWKIMLLMLILHCCCSHLQLNWQGLSKLTRGEQLEDSQDQSLGGVVDIFTNTNTTLYVTTSIQPYRWCHLNCYMTVLIGFTSLLIKIPESHMSII